MDRDKALRLSALGVILGILITTGCFTMINMPGASHTGPLPPLTEEMRTLEQELRAHVYVLANAIGERNLLRYEGLVESASYLRATLSTYRYDVRVQSYEVATKPCENIEVEIVGSATPEEIVVVGAHYDSVIGTPGANDNATGVAALLSLARGFSGTQPSRTLRFVAFVNEEPPYFQTSSMGSWVYAKRSRERDENIVAMVSLETIGYYSDEPDSQSYPPPFSLFYPSTGNFVAFVGNTQNGRLVRHAVDVFRRHAQFPSEGGALFGFLPGVGWSDHWSFWKEDYPAIMVTDTALFRYPSYHLPSDTPEKVRYDRLARVVSGLRQVIGELAGLAEPRLIR